MENPADKSIEERLAVLEQTVSELKQAIEKMSKASRQPQPMASEIPAPDIKPNAPPPTSTPEPTPVPETPMKVPLPASAHDHQTNVPPRPLPTRRPSQGFTLPDYMKTGEFWFNKIGIGLLLFAVVFLYRYSIEQGWITPPVRVMFGMFIGLSLLGLGLKLYKKRRNFSRVLLGGGIAALYITGFAAYQMYTLVPYTVAFAFMSLTTILSFILSLRQDEPSLSLIGILGGFGTPFLLYSDQGTIPAYITYVCLLLAGSGAVYFYKGWRSLLWVSIIGGWMVIVIPMEPVSFLSRLSPTDNWAIQIGIIFCWLTAWVIPILREVAWTVNPERWCKPILGFGDASLTDEAKRALDKHTHVLAVSAAVLGFGLSIMVWPDLSEKAWGGIAFGMAATYAVGFQLLRHRREFLHLAYTHILVAMLYITIGLCLLFEGDTLVYAVTGEALIFHLIARRLSDKPTEVAAHILWICIGIGILNRLMGQGQSVDIFSAYSLANLAPIAAAVFLSYVFSPARKAEIYFIAAAAALALWLDRGLSGNALVVALTVEAVIVQLRARQLKNQPIEVAAHILWVCIAFIIANRLIYHELSVSIFSAYSLADLVPIAAAVCLSYIFHPARKADVYFLAAAAALVLWLDRALSGNALLVTLTAETTLIHLRARQIKNIPIQYAGHIGIIGLCGLLIVRLFDYGYSATPIVNVHALSNLLLIVTMAAIGRYILNDIARKYYLVAGHCFFLGWLLSELAPLENGQGYVTICWGVYAIVLLVLGLLNNIRLLRIVSMSTLFVVVAKLFLVDLAHLETIWRILLFLCFGIVFLGIGYYFQSLWRTDGKTGDATEAKNNLSE